MHNIWTKRSVFITVFFAGIATQIIFYTKYCLTFIQDILSRPGLACNSFCKVIPVNTEMESKKKRPNWWNFSDKNIEYVVDRIMIRENRWFFLHFGKHRALSIRIPEGAMFLVFWYCYSSCKIIMLNGHRSSDKSEKKNNFHDFFSLYPQYN